MRRRNITETSLDKFLEAYKVLCSEVYIPERHREGYVKLIKRVGKLRDNTPTKIKLLQYKIELDDLLDEKAEEIYRKLKLD